MSADANDNVDNANNVVNRSITIAPILILVKTKNELPGNLLLLLLLLLLVVITVTTIPLSTQQVNGVEIKKTTNLVVAIDESCCSTQHAACCFPLFGCLSVLMMRVPFWILSLRIQIPFRAVGPRRLTGGAPGPMSYLRQSYDHTRAPKRLTMMIDRPKSI